MRLFPGRAAAREIAAPANTQKGTVIHRSGRTEPSIMNLENLIHKGVIHRPQRGIAYGLKSIGKTNLIADLDGALIIDAEASSHQYDCARINVGNYQQLDAALNALLTDPNDYRTIAFDTIDWIDEYIRAEVCREKGVGDIGEPPHGRGYILWRDKFTEFLLKLNGLIRLGKNVILIGHSQVRTVSLPGLDPYDRYELKLDKRNVETLTEWADFQIFLNWDIRTIKTKEGTVRARGGNDRFIYAVNDLAYDAKNRLGIVEPLKLEPASLMRFLGPVLAPASIRTPSPLAQEATAPISSQPISSESAPQLKLKEALFGLHEDWIQDFLIDRKKIAVGQTILDVSETYATEALLRITDFRAAIVAFGQDHDAVPMEETIS
jgi:AAA domain